MVEHPAVLAIPVVTLPLASSILVPSAIQATRVAVLHSVNSLHQEQSAVHQQDNVIHKRPALEAMELAQPIRRHKTELPAVVVFSAPVANVPLETSSVRL